MSTHCKVCDRTFQNEAALDTHLRSKGHKNKELEQAQGEKGMAEGTPPQGESETRNPKGDEGVKETPPTPQPDITQTLGELVQLLKPLGGLPAGVESLERTIKSHMEASTPSQLDPAEAAETAPVSAPESGLEAIGKQLEELKGMIPPDFCEKFPQFCAAAEGGAEATDGEPHDEESEEHVTAAKDQGRVVHMTPEEIMACNSPECVELKKKLAEGLVAGPQDEENDHEREEGSTAGEAGEEGASEPEPARAGKDLI